MVPEPESANGVLPDRVLLLTDHDLLAQSLIKVLAAKGVETERRQGAEALDVPHGGSYDLVLLDLDQRPERADLDRFLGGLRDTGTPLVVLTSTADAARLALQQGASGAVRKDQPAESLHGAIAEAMGARY